MAGEPTPELCDLDDNDCDGEVDEDFDTQSDPFNCGGCGQECADGVQCFAGFCGRDAYVEHMLIINQLLLMEE